jgi:hypothetical protein
MNQVIENSFKDHKKISDDWIIDEWYKSAIAGPTIVVN